MKKIYLISILLALISFSPIEYDRALILHVESMMKFSFMKSYTYLGDGWFEFTDSLDNRWQKMMGDARTMGGLKPKKIITLYLDKADTTGFAGMFRLRTHVNIGIAGSEPPMVYRSSVDSGVYLYGYQIIRSGNHGAAIYKKNKFNDDFNLVFRYDSLNLFFTTFGFGDVVGDRKDYMAGNNGEDIFIFRRSKPDSLFIEKAFSITEYSVAQVPRLADLDGDGLHEILYRQQLGGIYASVAKYQVKNNQLNRVFTTTYPAPPPSTGGFRGYWAIGDFDKDSHQEFVTANTRAVVYFVEHVQGDSSYRISFNDTTRFVNAFFHTEGNDLDRDGRPECFVGSSPAANITNIAVYETIGNDKYEVSAWIEILGAGSLDYEWLVSGDVDGDKRDELLVSIGGTVVVLKATGDDEWKVMWYKRYVSGTSVRVGDIDGDGVQEIFIPWQGGGNPQGTDIFSYNHLTSITSDREYLPTNSALSIFPNPTNTRAIINYSLEAKEKVLLRIFDLNGKLKTTLIDRIEEKGTHTYQLNATELHSGIYFIEQLTATKRETRKIMTIK